MNIKKSFATLCATYLCVTLVSCIDTNSTATAESIAPQQTAGTTENVNGAPQAPSGKNVIGLVTQVAGNQITVQIGTMERGNMGAGVAGERTEGETPESMTGERIKGEIPEGMTGERIKSEMPEGMTGERPEGMENGAGMGANMAGGMSDSADMSEFITLSDETTTYTIPVSTPVTQMGSEMTFSQIVKDTYISIQMNDDDTIIAINVLG